MRGLRLEEDFHFRGLLAYADVVGLASQGRALISPSIFDCWSTAVEEAKAVGVPLVQSGISVHREQAGAGALYFDHASPASAAEAMLLAWRRDALPLPAERRTRAESKASVRAV